MNQHPKNQSNQVLNKIVNLLAQRDHSQKELKLKLSRLFPSPIVEIALTEAAERGWLKDEREMALRVYEVLSKKNKGIIAINHYLKKKGLAPVKKNPGREIEKARTLLLKKFKKNDNWTLQEKQKALVYLERRGFDPDSRQKALNYTDPV